MEMSNFWLENFFLRQESQKLREENKELKKSIEEIKIPHEEMKNNILNECKKMVNTTKEELRKEFEEK